MSSGAPSGSPQAGGSGGGGGKSLELMQRRLLSAQDAAPAPAPQAAAPKETAPPAPSPAPPPAQVVSRPKGKNFAAMAKNNKSRPAPAPAPPPPAPAPAPMPASKPKGKDFSAMTKGKDFPSMSARMASPSNAAAAAAASSTSAAAVSQRNRAASLQAAARAAAGLPPLDKPTATSITTDPPPITPAKLPTPSHHSSNKASAAAGIAPPSSFPYIPRAAAAIAEEARQQHIANLASNKSKSSSSRTPAASRLRGSAPAKSPAATPTSSALPSVASAPVMGQQPARPTSQPRSSEARLTSQNPKLAAGVPHMAPLVGQRLRDLIQSLDPNYTIDAEAEEQVLQLADDFMQKVIHQSMRMARHRGSKILDVPDVQIVLAKQWGIVVPGLGAPTFRAQKGPNRAGTQIKVGGAGGSAGLKRKPSDTPLGSVASRPTSKVKTS